MQKLLGVIGGLGPMATALFLERIVRRTDAETDQQHIDIAIRHCPSIPDRTAFLLGESGLSPLPAIIEQAKILRDQGAKCIAIPCMTAHAFHREIEAECGLPVIDTIRLTADFCRNMGISRAAILATEGTIRVGLFQNALAEQGVETILPDKDAQKIITDLIYRDVKTGRAPDIALFQSAVETLRGQGAQAIILGCTELSVAAANIDLGSNVIDVLDILADASIEACGGIVRKNVGVLFATPTDTRNRFL